MIRKSILIKENKENDAVGRKTRKNKCVKNNYIISCFPDFLVSRLESMYSLVKEIILVVNN